MKRFLLVLLSLLPLVATAASTNIYDFLISTNFIIRDRNGKSSITENAYYFFGSNTLPTITFSRYWTGLSKSCTFQYTPYGFVLGDLLSVTGDLQTSGDLTVLGSIISSANLVYQTNIYVALATNAQTANFAKTCTGITYTNIYRALLTQSGTAAPVATVLENTFGNGVGVLVWTRNTTGTYTVTYTGGFPGLKTFISTPNNMVGVTAVATAARASDDTIKLYTLTFAGTLTDGLLKTNGIEILTYP